MKRQILAFLEDLLSDMQCPYTAINGKTATMGLEKPLEIDRPVLKSTSSNPRDVLDYPRKKTSREKKSGRFCPLTEFVNQYNDTFFILKQKPRN